MFRRSKEEIMLKFVIFLLICFSSAVAHARCNLDFIDLVEYSDNKKGEVFAFQLHSEYEMKIDTIVCLFSDIFLNKVANIPNRSTIVITNHDYSLGFIIQWDFREETFLLIDVNEKEEKAIYQLYPEPLKRIKEIFTSEPFPPLDKLPANQRSLYKTNMIKFSKEHIKHFFNN